MQHYLLQESQAYAAWRERKLNNFPKCADKLIFELNNPINLMDKEIDSLKDICMKANMVIYRCAIDTNPKQTALSLSEQFGLHLDANICADEDRISAIEDSGASQSRYIPYTNKALNWHTDGYYNAKPQRIHAFLMHCVRPAKSGGENQYLDPEIAYILLRDENPNYIEALMDETVMTIPANVIEHRDTQTGPVFYLDQLGNLCMRFTARKRNIIWKHDKNVQNALACLKEILSDNTYVFKYRLNSKEGVICNNVLHTRTAFEDDEQQKRLLYRGRFYNRVTSGDAIQKVVSQ